MDFPTLVSSSGDSILNSDDFRGQTTSGDTITNSEKSFAVPGTRCGQVGDRDFPHDLWVMAPVYEGGALYLGGHHSSTVLLVRRNDLSSFRDWERCRAMHVEHRSHGERILTLLRMAVEFDRQTRWFRSEGRSPALEVRRELL